MLAKASETAILNSFGRVTLRNAIGGDAEKAFRATGVNVERLEAILEGLERAKKTVQWKNEQFIPYPAKWLEARGWEDEHSKTIINERGIEVINPVHQ